MEDNVLGIMNDISDIEEQIFRSLKDNTISERLIPSILLDPADIMIQQDEDGQKYIQVDDDTRLPIVGLFTPQFALQRTDLDSRKNMKSELIHMMSVGIGGIWDGSMLAMLDKATVTADTIVLRESAAPSLADIVEAINVIERNEHSEVAKILMHKNTFDPMPCWAEDVSMDEAKIKCEEEGVLLGKELLLSVHRSYFTNIYCFGRRDSGADLPIGLSYLSKPEIMVKIDRDSIRISGKVLTARSITDISRISKSALHVSVADNGK